MKKIIKKIINIVLSPFILKDYISFFSKRDSRFSLNIFDFYPQIKDKTIKTGFDRHYVYHTSWAARKVKDFNPQIHTDISSLLYFSGILSAFVPVKFYDYRPAELKLSNLQSEHADLMNLPFEENSLQSLSCMHTVEHIGLGRYGDPIDPQGDIKACKELSRVLANNGQLIFVTPVGKPKIEFNAHRIYSFQQVINLFPNLVLKEFSLVTDRPEQGDFIENADSNLVAEQKYGCGCFIFTKHDNS
jgi:SAM-dependent methyltransferase